MAVGLVLASAVLTSSLDDWAGLPYVLGLNYLGIVLLLGATVGAIGALVAAAVAVGVVGILAAAVHDPSIPRGPRVVGVAVPWTAIRPRWFDVSGAAIAIVGGIGLAVAHPLVNAIAVDVVADVLVLTGLLYCLIGRPTGVAGGLLFLVSAAALLLQETGRAPARTEMLFLAAVQMVLAMALLHLQEARQTDAADARAAIPVPLAAESEPKTEAQRAEPPVESAP